MLTFLPGLTFLLPSNVHPSGLKSSAAADSGATSSNAMAMRTDFMGFT